MSIRSSAVKAWATLAKFIHTVPNRARLFAIRLK